MIDAEKMMWWKAAIDKATNGEWRDAGFEDDNDLHWISADGGNPCYPRESPMLGGYYSAADRDLAIIARTALPEAIAEIERLTVDVDTKSKASAAWEGLFNERDRLLRASGDKIDAVGALLAHNGCDCECDHSWDEHDESCERCLACRIDAALGKP